jgi:chromosome segregation ATPase
VDAPPGELLPEGWRLPETIDDCLLFKRSSLARLRARIGELVEENKTLARRFKELHRHKGKLTREKRVKETQIGEAEQRCHELQMLKFGQVVHLDQLDKVTNSTGVEEVERSIKEADVTRAAEGSKLQRAIAREKQRLVELTQENTKLLQAIAELTAKQSKLERDLNTGGSDGVHVSDGGAKVKAEAEERGRLLQLAKLQAREMDALKAEISMLRRKGGHIYTAPPR